MIPPSFFLYRNHFHILWIYIFIISTLTVSIIMFFYRLKVVRDSKWFTQPMRRSTKAVSRCKCHSSRFKTMLVSFCRTRNRSPRKCWLRLFHRFVISIRWKCICLNKILQEQKQMLGERLYPLIGRVCKELNKVKLSFPLLQNINEKRGKV